MWKQVPGHPDYEVSDEGKARSRWSESVGRRGPHGYMRVSMNGDDFLLHRVVLETFVGPPPPGAYGRHLNDDRSDNRLENLAWGTPQDNVNDMLCNRGHYKWEQDTCKRGHPLQPNPWVEGARYCPVCKADWRNRTGRTRKGYNPNQKLTDEQVCQIRAEYVEGRRGEFARLGRAYGISSVQARNIALGLQRAQKE